MFQVSGQAPVTESVVKVKRPLMYGDSLFSARKYVYSPGRKTKRELVEEREQRMKENDKKMMQIKEKEEELKKMEEKLVMAVSTAIDKWVEHANDEGWLTSIVQSSTTLMYICSLSCISIYSVSILLSSVSEADVRGFLE